MNKKYLLLLFIVASALIYWFFIRSSDVDHGPKQAPIQVGKHSDRFNEKMEQLIQAYQLLGVAFAQEDTLLVRSRVPVLLQAADSLPLDELKKDTASVLESVRIQLNDLRLNAESINQQTSLTEMRQDYRMVGECLYPLLKTIVYRGKLLYWLRCPTAFGDGRDANWLSNDREGIQNPFTGKTPSTNLEVLDSLH